MFVILPNVNCQLSIGLITGGGAGSRRHKSGEERRKEKRLPNASKSGPQMFPKWCFCPLKCDYLHVFLHICNCKNDYLHVFLHFFTRQRSTTATIISLFFTQIPGKGRASRAENFTVFSLACREPVPIHFFDFCF